MGTATVVRRETSELREEREAILAQVGMSERELHDRASEYLLTREESVAWRRIQAINWLLND